MDVIEGRARWCVVTADCLDVLPTLPSGCVEHVITDPPYLGARGDSWESSRVPLELPYAPASVELLERLVSECSRLRTRWALVFNDYEGEACLRAAFARTQTPAAKQPIVWVRPPGSFAPNGSAYSPPKQCEFITASRARKITGLPVPGAYVSEPFSPVEILRTGGKPLSLMTSIVGDFTEPNHVILDPFCGSGTTGVAAIRLCRRFIGIEKDPAYAEVARERIRAEERGLTLKAARAGQVSIFDLMGKG